MKSSLLGMRLGHVSGAVALAILGTAAACSSSSTPVSTGDAGMSNDAGAGGYEAGTGPVMAGTGAMCPMLTDEWVGTLFTLNVTWPATAALNGGMGPIYIWQLTHYTINGLNLTGTARTCGSQVPALVPNATGKIAEGLQNVTGPVLLLNETPTSQVFDHDTRTAMTTGVLGGWNVGSSITITPTTSLTGLSQMSQWADPTVAWPPAQTATSAIPASDITDDDNDGNPGITLYPLYDPGAGYYLPATGLGGTSPRADELYVVERTQLEAYGTSSSCTENTGTIAVPEYVDRIVGCHDQNTAGTSCTVATGCACMASEWQFIDGNATVFSGMGGPKSLITGTFDSKQMSADGSVPTCDELLALFPPPMPVPVADSGPVWGGTSVDAAQGD